MKHGKNYRNALAQVDREELLSVTDAIEKVKSLSTAKFDETVELAIRLGVDPRRAEQIVRGTLSLPAGTGKTNRVAVFAAGEAAQAARDAGADEVGAEDLVAKAVTEFKGGRVEYRTDKIGNVQLRVGKVSFSRDDLIKNVRAVVDEVIRVKPASAKGRYIMSITVSSTMGPGVKVDPAQVKAVEEVAVPA